MLPSLLYNYSTLNTLALGALIIPVLWSLRGGDANGYLQRFDRIWNLPQTVIAQNVRSVCTEIQSTGSSPPQVGVVQTLTEHSAVKQSKTTVTAD